MSLEQIKQLIEENKNNNEVQEYLRGLNPYSVEGVKEFVKSGEGEKWFDSEKDRHSAKSLETWKTNNLSKLVDAEVKKLNPEMTEEQRQINELKQQLEDQRKEAAREKNMNKAISHATDKQLPANSDLLSFFVGDDEESTLNNLGVFEESFNSAVQKAIESKFKESGRQIESGSKPATNIQDLSEIAKSVNIRNQ